MPRVLCLLDGNEGGDAALPTALAAGRALDAYVEVLHVQADPREAMPIAAEGMTATMIDSILDAVHQDNQGRQARATDLIERQVRAAGLPEAPPDGPAPSSFAVGFRVAQGHEASLVARQGMLYDLIVLARHHRDGEPPVSETLEAAIMESGRPVLVAPRDALGSLGTRPAVAWRATVPGVHALAGALPFLRRAVHTTVLTVGETGKGPPPDEVVRYLDFHGIPATAAQVAGESKDVGQSILEQAAAAEADLLVMGAYAHSRLRQLILGGVTRTVLTSASLPLLLAH